MQMSKLRDYQHRIKDGVFAGWAQGHRNVLVKSPTGSGKTVVKADIIRTLDVPTAAIAHRGELVTQISLALAREGVYHRIVGPDALRRQCVSLQMMELERSYFNASAPVGVCGVDTLVKRDVGSWAANVQLWVQDEAHHVLKANKWGAAAAMFPNARGLGVTATPCRADGKGLGAQNDGLFDVMVEGPEMRELINQGHLTDYKVYAPPSDVDYSEVTVTSTGDYSPAKLRAAVHASNSFVGDVVAQYLRVAAGKLAVVFAVDVLSAGELAAAFRAAGVTAEVVSAGTDVLLRAKVLRDFAARRVQVLVNVDLFGEGFDVPAIEVVIMARKTESWPLYVQQFGRALRLMLLAHQAIGWADISDNERLGRIAQSPKPYAIIIDHVGNVIRHGLPDAPRVDTLERRERRQSAVSDAIPLRACKSPLCLQVYPRYNKLCPYCGYYSPPADRSAPEYVDGDLFELTPEALAALRGKVIDIGAGAVVPRSLGDGLAAAGYIKQHNLRCVAQSALREAMSLWAGWQELQGYDLSQIYRRFYHQFGVDVLTAQSLYRADADALASKVLGILAKYNITRAA